MYLLDSVNYNSMTRLESKAAGLRNKTHARNVRTPIDIAFRGAIRCF